MKRQVYQPLAPGQPPKSMTYPAQGQVYYNNQYIQQQPQVITVQTHPQNGAMYQQGQVFSSGNPIGTWFNPNYGQNFMVVQSSTPSQSQMLPLVASYGSNSMAPQTIVGNASASDYNSPPAWTQIRPRRRISVPSSTSSPSYTLWSTAENETQTNESFSQIHLQLQTQPVPQQKSDTSNQTSPNRAKPTETPEIESKEESAIETISSSEAETLNEELQAKRLSQQMSVNFQAIMASLPEVTQATVSSSSSISLSVDIVTDTALTTSAISPIVSSTVFSNTAPVAPVMTSTETSMLTSSSSLPEVSDISSATDSISVPDAAKQVSEKLSSNETSTPLSPFNILGDADIQDSDTVDYLRMEATEEAVGLLTSPIKKKIIEKKDKELSLSTEKSPLTKEKQTPKAIVKPQVMTQVIEGVAIAEASEPYLSLKSSHTEYQEMTEEFHAATPRKQKINSCRGRKRGRRGRRGRPKLLNLVEHMDVKEEEVAPVEKPIFETQKIGECLAFDISSIPETSVTVKADERADVSEINHTKKLYQEWNVEEVFEFVKEFPGCSDYAEAFRSQEIDGQALLLLKVDHLMTSMCMKLGPALKLIAHINNFKEELSLQAQT